MKLKEITRRFFVSLNWRDGIYFVMKDGQFDHEIPADSEAEAIKKFNEEYPE